MVKLFKIIYKSKSKRLAIMHCLSFWVFANKKQRDLMKSWIHLENKYYNDFLKYYL